MSQDSFRSTDRRSFLKRSATAATVAGGLAFGTGSAAAAGKEYKVTVYTDPNGGDYRLEVPDDDPVEQDTESSDEVSSLDDTAILEGKVTNGWVGPTKDRYKFDNQAGWSYSDLEDLVKVHELASDVSYDVEEL